MKLKVIVLIFLCAAFNVHSKIVVKYPDLTGARPIIIERQKELYNLLQKVEKESSSYSKSEAFGKLAQFYYIHEYVEASIPFYIKAIELSPTNSKWHYLLGLAYKSKGEFDKVITSFERSWSLNSQYLPVKVYLGEVYLQQGLFDKAKAAFKSVLTQDSKYSRALVGLGQVLMQEGNAEAAIDKYKMAIKFQPTANQINFLISTAYASLGNMETSKKFNSKKGSIQAQMFDPLVVSLYEESRSYTYYNNKAVQAYKAGDYASSEVLANQAREYEPESPYPKVTLANIYVSTDRVKLAVSIMEGVVQENRENTSFKYILGIIEEINGNNNKSIKLYESVLKLDKNHKKAHLNLSNALMRSGDYDKALRQLQQLQNLDPENPSVLHKQASVYAYQNKCALATDGIYKAVKLQPKNLAFLLTFIKIAVHCPVDSQTLTDALNAARNIYQISQNNYVVENLALIEAKNNNYKEAIDYQAQAIFQELLSKSEDSKSKIKKLKNTLAMFKNSKYPKVIFKKDDIDLNPQNFTRIR